MKKSTLNMENSSQEKENSFIDNSPVITYIDVIYVSCFKIFAPSEGGEII